MKLTDKEADDLFQMTRPYVDVHSTLNDKGWICVSFKFKDDKTYEITMDWEKLKASETDLIRSYSFVIRALLFHLEQRGVVDMGTKGINEALRILEKEDNE